MKRKKLLDSFDLKMIQRICETEPLIDSLINLIANGLINQKLDVFVENIVLPDIIKEKMLSVLNLQWSKKIRSFLCHLLTKGFVPYYFVKTISDEVELIIPEEETYNITVEFDEFCEKKFKFFWKNEYFRFRNITTNFFPLKFFNKNYKGELSTSFEELLDELNKWGRNKEREKKKKLTSFGFEDPDVMIFLHDDFEPKLDGTLNSVLKRCFTKIQIMENFTKNYLLQDTRISNPRILIQKQIEEVVPPAINLVHLNNNQMENDMREKLKKSMLNKEIRDILEKSESSKNMREFETIFDNDRNTTIYNPYSTITDPTDSGIRLKFIPDEWKAWQQLKINRNPNFTKILNIFQNSISNAFGVPLEFINSITKRNKFSSLNNENVVRLQQTIQSWGKIFEVFFSKKLLILNYSEIIKMNIDKIGGLFKNISLNIVNKNGEANHRNMISSKSFENNIVKKRRISNKKEKKSLYNLLKVPKFTVKFLGRNNDQIKVFEHLYKMGFLKTELFVDYLAKCYDYLPPVKTALLEMLEDEEYWNKKEKFEEDIEKLEMMQKKSFSPSSKSGESDGEDFFHERYNDFNTGEENEEENQRGNSIDNDRIKNREFLIDHSGVKKMERSKGRNGEARIRKRKDFGDQRALQKGNEDDHLENSGITEDFEKKYQKDKISKKRLFYKKIKAKKHIFQENN